MSLMPRKVALNGVNGAVEDSLVTGGQPAVTPGHWLWGHHPASREAVWLAGGEALALLGCWGRGASRRGSEGPQGCEASLQPRHGGHASLYIRASPQSAHTCRRGSVRGPETSVSTSSPWGPLCVGPAGPGVIRPF